MLGPDGFVGAVDKDTVKTAEVQEGVNDTSANHQYVFAVSELTADRTVTLPLLDANDTFVFAEFEQTLNNKTIDCGTF